MEAVAEHTVPGSFIEEEDVMAMFLAECCTKSEGFVSMHRLYACYAKWCKDYGMIPWPMHRVSKDLRSKGLARVMIDGFYRWEGLGLRFEEFRETPAGPPFIVEKRQGNDPMKVGHDYRTALLDAHRLALHLGSRMRQKALVHDPVARALVKELSGILDLMDQLGVLAREVGVQL